MILIDYKDTRPLYEQVSEKFQTLIEKGVLKPDTQMPSVRALAVELSINPNTIQKAYAELERRGYIYTIKGRGNFVSFDENVRERRKQEQLAAFRKMLEKVIDAGITKEEVFKVVEKLYSGKVREDD